MKKWVILLTWAVLMVQAVAPVWAKDAQFKDVSASHWANKAVYNLVKMGVVQGYPDGTFRGTRAVTRYEMAVYLSNLALAARRDLSEIVKLMQEFKTELDEVKTQVAQLRNDQATDWQISGTVDARLVVTDLLLKSAGASRRFIPDARAQVGVDKKWPGSYLRVGLDTNDVQWQRNSTQRSLNNAGRLFDGAGAVSWNMGVPLTLAATFGPGNQVRESDGSIIPRPYNSLELGTNLSGISLAGRYMALGDFSGSGVEVNRLTATAGYNFPVWQGLETRAAVDYFRKSGADRFKWQVKASLEPVDNLIVSGKVAGAKFTAKELLLGAKISLADYFKTGTTVSVEGTRSGQDYRRDGLAEPIEDFDNFMYAIANNYTDFGVELVQKITQKASLKGKVNLDFQNGQGHKGTIWEAGVAYALNPSATLGVNYRVYSAKNDAQTTNSDFITAGVQVGF